MIEIEDINLHAPIIKYGNRAVSSTSVSWYENSAADIPFITLSANDEDKGLNGKVQFRIKLQVSVHIKIQQLLVATLIFLVKITG